MAKYRSETSPINGRSTRAALSLARHPSAHFKHETASLSDSVEINPAPPDPNTRLAEQIEANFEARRKELGVADELKAIPGLTTLMLVAFGEQGIRTVDDLAGCATDDLCGRPCGDNFPVRRKNVPYLNFPVPLCREFACKPLNLF